MGRGLAIGRRVAILASAVVLVAGGSSSRATTASLSLEIDSSQNVTLVGNGDSLRATIVEVCARANVELVAYEAADRPFAASYHRVPLAEVLARLLRSEVYLAGVRPRRGQARTEVTWLRVTGSAGGVTEIRPSIAIEGNDKEAYADIELGVAPKVMETALESADAGARSSARRAVVLALREDATPLERYLASDTSELVSKLAPYPHAVELAQSLETVADDGNERTLLRSVTHALRVLQEADRREAERGAPSTK
jgi:hypothetical protein